MRNPERWRPSKFVMRGGRLHASRDAREVGVGSRLMSEAIARAYFEHLPRHARGRLIDLGCGKAPLYLVYRGQVASVTCVDWPESMHGGEYLDRTCDLSAPLPFEDASFDTIVLSDVLEHIAEPQALFREMARILAPGGTLLMNTPFFYWLHETPHDYHRYTEFALRRLAAGAGFDVLELDTLGGAGAVLADLIAKRLMTVPLAGGLLADLVQSTAVALGVLRRSGRATHGTELFPFGYFMVARRR